MQKRLIVVLGILLASSMPASAQTLTARLDFSQTRPALGMTLLSASSRDLPLTANKQASSLAERPVRFPVAFAVVNYRNPELERPVRFLVDLNQTPFLSQARISLVQMWGGRLRLDGMARALSVKDLLDGPLNSVHPGTMQPRAAAAYGLSISFRLGRDASQEGNRRCGFRAILLGCQHSDTNPSQRSAAL